MIQTGRRPGQRRPDLVPPPVAFEHAEPTRENETPPGDGRKPDGVTRRGGRRAVDWTFTKTRRRLVHPYPGRSPSCWTQAVAGKGAAGCRRQRR